MVKQEEIRGVIDDLIEDVCLYPKKTCVSFKSNYCLDTDSAYKCLMKRLTELGVVIQSEDQGVLYALHNNLKRVVVEPLILEPDSKGPDGKPYIVGSSGVGANNE
tara:strand:+ start:230 stop:544 length:315 start_codon:yes stop_codon:yes gene_type:complete